MTVKHLWAWLLLVLLSCQWIAGALVIKLRHTALITSEMEAEEAALSQELALKYGIDSRVNILDEEEQEFLLQLGYGTPFIFSLSDEDSTALFLLETEKVEMITMEIPIKLPEHGSDPDKALAKFNRLFSPYIINQVTFLEPVEQLRDDSGDFIYRPLKDLFLPAIPTPPPASIV